MREKKVRGRKRKTDQMIQELRQIHRSSRQISNMAIGICLYQLLMILFPQAKHRKSFSDYTFKPY